MQQNDSLVERIEQAFASAVLPSGAKISLPTYDDEGTAAYFQGKTWHGHTARQLRALDFSLTVFTPEAFAYFLPAYLVADITTPKEADTISEALLFWLSPAGGDSERAQLVVARLSQPQREVVAAYFELVRERDGVCGQHEEALYEAVLRLLRKEHA